MDEIAAAGRVSVSEALSALTMLELKGLARQTGGMNYVLAREGRVEYLIG